MSITNWIYKILGIDNSRTTFDVPSEYKLPTKNSDVNMQSRDHDLFSVNLPTDNNDGNMHHFGHDDFFEDTDSFENNLNKLFNVSFEELLRQFETELFNNNENINNSVFIENDQSYDFNESPNGKEHDNNKIPKKNLMARNYFLRQGSVPNISDKPLIRVALSPELNFGQSSTGYNSSTTRTFMSGQYNNRIIEKETTTKQLQSGLTEKVIVLKDGNQKCITTITENLKTGEQISNKQLVNLDESQLNEFENRFSKFR